VHSPQTLRVLVALAAQPDSWRHGYDLCVELGIKSGSLYPILMRLSDRGFLDSTWESAEAGKPPRHLYRLTPDGVAEAAEAAVAAVAPTRAPLRRTRLGTA
jgi:DNA-binding PadR family transcriptional regulator